MTPRSRTPEPPYCWQNKEALRKIREHLDGDSLLPYALGVYCALTENASDKGAEEFTTLQSHLALLAGDISTRTIRRVLPILREIGVIDYQTPELRGPITFRLLSVGTDSPNDGTNSPNVRTSKKTGFQSYNRSNREVTEKKQRKNRSQEVTSDFIAQQQAFFSHLNAEQEFGRAQAWISARPRRRMTRRFFVDWLKRAEQPATIQKEEW
jgi:hypothetical protein